MYRYVHKGIAIKVATELPQGVNIKRRNPGQDKVRNEARDRRGRMCQTGLFGWTQRPRRNAAKPRGEAWRGQGSSVLALGLAREEI